LFGEFNLANAVESKFKKSSGVAMTHTATQTLEQTLSIIKPDAVEQNQIGNIIEYFEREGLCVVAAKMLHLSAEQAGGFYAAHKDKPFFADLVAFMISGPVLAMVLEGEHAVARNREIMGATDPSKAKQGTVRCDFATSIEHNAVHGSDSLENAKKEVAFFFKSTEIFHRA
jgi:nucleoside-diphosphate kinase